MKALKKITTTLALALTLTLVIPSVPFTNQVQTVEAAKKATKAKPKKAKVKINKTKATLNKGKKVTLKITGTKSKVKWSTNKKSIATVTQKGVVTAKKKGTVTITAKVGKKKYTCKVTVKQPVTKPKTNDKGLIIIPNPHYKEVGENDPKIYTLLNYNPYSNSSVGVKVANEGKKPIIIKREAYLNNDANDPSKSCKVYLPDFRNNTTVESLTLEPILKDKMPPSVLFAPYPFDKVLVNEKSTLTFNFIYDGVEYTTTASYYSARNDYTKVK